MSTCDNVVDIYKCRTQPTFAHCVEQFGLNDTYHDIHEYMHNHPILIRVASFATGCIAALYD